MITFNDFIENYKLRNKATSSTKRQQVLTFLSLDDIGIYLRVGPFKSDIGIVNLHPSKGTHWVCYINENCYGCASPKKLSKFVIKRNGYCLYSEYQIQKNDSYCSSYCLYTIHLTKVIDIDFKTAVLKL